jgi:hypothetical protein
VDDLEARGRAAAAAAAAEAARLLQRVAELEAGLYNTGFTLNTAQVRVRGCGAPPPAGRPPLRCSPVG